MSTAAEYEQPYDGDDERGWSPDDERAYDFEVYPCCHDGDCCCGDRSGPPAASDPGLGELLDGPAADAMFGLGIIRDVPTTQVPPAVMVQAVLGAQRLISWARAQQHRWTAALARPDAAVPVSEVLDCLAHRNEGGRGGHDIPDELVDRAAAGTQVVGDQVWDALLAAEAASAAEPELSAAWLVAPITARRRIADAQELVDDLPDTFKALEEGRIEEIRARIIAETTAVLDPDLRRRAEALILDRARRGMCPGDLRRLATKVVADVDPEAAAKRAEQARAGRGTGVRNLGDDLGRFTADLAVEDATLTQAVLDLLAKAIPPEARHGRGISQLRADIFADLFGELADTGLIDLRGIHPHPDTTDADADADQPDPNVDPDPTQPAGSDRDNATATTDRDAADADADQPDPNVEPDPTQPAGSGRDNATATTHRDAAHADADQPDPNVEPDPTQPAGSDRDNATATTDTDAADGNVDQDPTAGVADSGPADPAEPSDTNAGVESADPAEPGETDATEPDVAQDSAQPDPADPAEPGRSDSGTHADTAHADTDAASGDLEREADTEIVTDTAGPETTDAEAAPAGTENPADQSDAGEPGQPWDESTDPEPDQGETDIGPNNSTPNNSTPGESGPGESGPVDQGDPDPDRAAAEPPGPTAAELLARLRSIDWQSRLDPNCERRGGLLSMIRLPAGVRVNLDVTVALSTLAGYDDLSARLAGLGVITADTARALAKAAGTVRILVTNDPPRPPGSPPPQGPPPTNGSPPDSSGDGGDSSNGSPDDAVPARRNNGGIHHDSPDCGTVLDFGRATYRPPATVIDRVDTRDQRCRFPGCPQVAERSDHDHRIAWDDGGATCPCDLDALCRFHHRAKTFTAWTAIRDQRNNTLTWTSPLGRVHVDRPAPDLPTGTPINLDDPNIGPTDAGPPPEVADATEAGVENRESGTDRDPDDPPF